MKEEIKIKEFDKEQDDYYLGYLKMILEDKEVE